jgi:hypothetical protein
VNKKKKKKTMSEVGNWIFFFFFDVIAKKKIQESDICIDRIYVQHLTYFFFNKLKEQRIIPICGIQVMHPYTKKKKK